MSSEAVRPRTVAQALKGEAVGTPDGDIICDYCNARYALSEGRGSEPDPYSQVFRAYATDGPRGYESRRLACPGCMAADIEEPTEGHVEAVVSVTVEFIGIGVPPCQIIEANTLGLSQA